MCLLRRRILLHPKVIESPGRAIGRVNTLARTSIDPPEFIRLRGDSAHHCGGIWQSRYIRLPKLTKAFSDP